VKRTSSRPKIVVTADGRGVVGHAGTRLLVDLADATGLASAVSDALASLRQRDSGHDPGRVALDLAVMLADGGEAIADLAVLRGQPDLLGPVASDPTAWRLLAALDDDALSAVRAARAQAREVAWAQAADTGRAPTSTIAGFTIPGLVLEVDATIVTCHSDKESAAKTWKKTWGYHPLLCFLDATGEALVACLDWQPAIDADGDLRDGAEIAEISHLVDLSGYPDGTRMIVRRERPRPGAQLSLFDSIEGLRHQVFVTDTPRPTCSVQLLELRHRAHARVEDRIRTGKDTGLGRFPSRMFAINAAWLELALIGIDLLAWARVLLLDGHHAQAEPKRLRYQLLHVAARITRTARRTYLRIAERWPWANVLTTAFTRLHALPRATF
jgi:hypothetical protein